MTAYVATTGGREYNRYRTIETVVARLHDAYMDNLVLVNGVGRGCDRLVLKVALMRGIEVVQFPADWSNLGTCAGFVRNRKMAKFLCERRRRGHLGFVVAFPGGNGTEDMCMVSREMGLEVQDHSWYLKEGKQ